MARDTILSTAIHEAGHAVAMLSAPLPRMPRKLSVFDKSHGYVSGHARFQRDAQLPTALELPAVRAAIEMDIVEFLAGPIAEMRWRWRDRAAVLIAGGVIGDRLSQTEYCERSDFGNAKFRLGVLRDQGPGASFLQLWDRAEEQIAAHWRRVVALGRMLAAKKEVSRDELMDWWEG